MGVRAIIEVRGKLVEFDGEADCRFDWQCWSCPSDKLLEGEVQDVAWGARVESHNNVAIAHGRQVEEVARLLGAKIISLTGHEGPFPYKPLPPGGVY